MLRSGTARALGWAAAMAAAWLLPATPALGGVGEVPTPTVAKLPITADSKPFGATTDPAKLADNGYVEEEYTIAGGAFKYDTVAGADGTKLTDGPNGDGSYPYKTRILVRRPASPADFNGRVLVEWFNVTAGFDLDTSWGSSHDSDLMREGYAWVGVSAQVVGIDFLTGWFRDPTRYADLMGVTGVDRADRDRASYDIFSQAAKAILGAGDGPDPMGNLDPTMLIASGASQSGGRLSRYYDSIQNLHEVIDSFLLTVSNGALRDDLDAKVMRLVSERETLGGPSSEVDNDSYRRWEIAGASHVPEETGRYWEPLNGRDLIEIVFDCKEQPLADIQFGEVRQAALAALVSWQSGGPAPAIAPRMTYDGTDEVVRDAYGIGAGGIRLPGVDVPVATNTPINEPAPGGTDPFSAGFCTLLGANLPFDDATLAGLYRDLGDYVERYAAAADVALAQGFITPEGAERLKDEATEYPRLRPTRPEVDRAQAKARGKSEDRNLGWFGSTAPDTTFELQHRAKRGGWSGVAGADALRSPAFSLAKERREGTYRYRVKSSTDVPLETYRALSGQVLSTDYSRASKKVKIDRSGPREPKLRLIGRRRADGSYVGRVKIRVVGRGDPKLRDGSKGSGVDVNSKPKTRVREKGDGRYTVRAWIVDNAGNRSKARVRRFEVR